MANNTAFQLDVAPNVPQSEIEIILEGISIAKDYLTSIYGEAIPTAIEAASTVKVEATGLGNQEIGGGGASATAYSLSTPELPRLYFDVAHDQYEQPVEGRAWTSRADKIKIVVHEYVHGWQLHLGAASISHQPLGFWLNEGIAEYLAYSALVSIGEMKWNDIKSFMVTGASQDQLSSELELFGETTSPIWPGHVGFLAIDWLVSEAPNGIAALKVIAQEIDQGANQAEAFLAAFNVELSEFYKQFEIWRPVLVADPISGLNQRPALVTRDEEPTNGDNSFVLTSGNDNIDGLLGLDTASFDVARSQIEVLKSGTVITATGQGTDTLVNIERLVFTDGTLAFDTDGTAGQAYRIYKAAFDRTPDNDGLKFWIGELDRGMDLIQAAVGFVSSAEFNDVYSGASSNHGIVEKLYQNVLGRDGETGGIDFWTSELNSGARNTAQVLADFSASPENIATVAPLISDGIFYA